MIAVVASVWAATVALVFAQNTTGSGNFVNIFINDGLGGEAEYAASIKSACSDRTVYAIRCTSADVAENTCGPNAPVRASHSTALSLFTACNIS